MKGRALDLATRPVAFPLAALADYVVMILVSFYISFS